MFGCSVSLRRDQGTSVLVSGMPPVTLCIVLLLTIFVSFPTPGAASEAVMTLVCKWTAGPNYFDGGQIDLTVDANAKTVTYEYANGTRSRYDASFTAAAITWTESASRGRGSLNRLSGQMLIDEPSTKRAYYACAKANQQF